jgi:hypothetical protein
MLPQFLLPETDARQDGEGPRISINSPESPILLTLGITRTLEQADLQVTVWGSSDGEQWRQLTTFPRKSYCGTYSAVLDLELHPDIRHLRAQWTMNRWGLGEPEPLFGFYLLTEAVQLQRVGAA